MGRKDGDGQARRPMLVMVIDGRRLISERRSLVVGSVVLSLSVVSDGSARATPAFGGRDPLGWAREGKVR